MTTSTKTGSSGSCGVRGLHGKAWGTANSHSDNKVSSLVLAVGKSGLGSQHGLFVGVRAQAGAEQHPELNA
jgi:hypothetical protein